MSKSFIKRVQPSRKRWKDVDWPAETEDGAPVQVRVHVLGSKQLEEAYDAAEKFVTEERRKTKGQKPAAGDRRVASRERTEMMFRAFSIAAEEGEGRVPIAESVDELHLEPAELIDALYALWSEFQREVTVRPMTQEEHNLFVSELKKNSRSVPLSALPGSWLIEFIHTLASQLGSSTPASSPG